MDEHYKEQEQFGKFKQALLDDEFSDPEFVEEYNDWLDERDEEFFEQEDQEYEDYLEEREYDDYY
jgi:hypothetical protein